MNNAEAKFILQGYRPSGADAGDATFCAAIEQAKSDPALGEWFARQQAFDATVGAKLGEVQPPADLRAAILAGGRVTSTSARSATVRWIRPVWLAAAASVAVLFALGVTLWPRSAQALDDFAVADAQLGAIHGHGDRGADTNRLQWALSQAGTRLGQRLPVEFSTLKDGGCRVVRFHGRDLLEVCFNRNGVWYHCYIAKAADFPEIAWSGAPHLEQRAGAALAAWKNGDQIVLIVSRAGLKEIQALL